MPDPTPTRAELLALVERWRTLGQGAEADAKREQPRTTQRFLHGGAGAFRIAARELAALLGGAEGVRG